LPSSTARPRCARRTPCAWALPAEPSRTAPRCCPPGHWLLRRTHGDVRLDLLAIQGLPVTRSPRLGTRRALRLHGQAPWSAALSCDDSRYPGALSKDAGRLAIVLGQQGAHARDHRILLQALAPIAHWARTYGLSSAHAAQAPFS
jgi:hypothetical protein